MSPPLLLILVGLGVPALALVIYPLLLVPVAQRLRTNKPHRHPPADLQETAVIEADPSRAEAYRRAGLTVVADPRDTARPLLVFPGRDGRLTPGGVRRLAAPLADPKLGLVVGRLLIPEPEDRRGRDAGRDCVLVAEGMRRGWRRFLHCREAEPGIPTGLAGAPCAVRAGFWDGTPARTLERLANSPHRCLYLAGRRGLVGRLEPVAELASLRRRLLPEVADELAARRAHPGLWLRRLLAGAPLWIALLLTGGLWGTLTGGGVFFKLALIAAAVPLIGALVGYQTQELGFRSRVYLPLYWLAAESGLLLRGLLSGRSAGRKGRRDG